jgi:hypothetical protein
VNFVPSREVDALPARRRFVPCAAARPPRADEPRATAYGTPRQSTAEADPRPYRPLWAQSRWRRPSMLPDGLDA